MQKEFSILIPIKKRSQRVSNKNYRDFNGKPLWKRAIDKFVDCNLFIDTDDPDLVREVNFTYPKVTCYLRSEKLLGHSISVCELIKYWVETYNPPGFLFQVHVTSPFIKLETILLAMSSMGKEHDSIFSVNSYQSRFWHDGIPVNHDSKELIQTQDLVPVYEENSLFYGFTKTVALSGMRIGETPKLYNVGSPEALDIDTQEDWDRCLEVEKNV